ncbi:hypothetical protein [Vibrio phage BONAISHI]|nr:hypothetical protein [Vibrio phage BONAISHI]
MRQEKLTLLSDIRFTAAWLAIVPGRDVNSRIVLSSTGILDGRYSLKDVYNGLFHGNATWALERDLKNLQDIYCREEKGNKITTLVFKRQQPKAGEVVMEVDCCHVDDTLKITETWKSGTHQKLIMSDGICKQKRFFNAAGTIVKAENRWYGLNELGDVRVRDDKTYDPETGEMVHFGKSMKVIERDDKNRPICVDIISDENYRQKETKRFKVSYVSNGNGLTVQRMKHIDEHGKKTSMAFYVETSQLIFNNTDMMADVKIKFKRLPDGSNVIEEKVNGNGSVETYRYILGRNNEIAKIKKKLVTHHGSVNEFLLFKLKNTKGVNSVSK